MVHHPQLAAVARAHRDRLNANGDRARVAQVGRETQHIEHLDARIDSVHRNEFAPVGRHLKRVNMRAFEVNKAVLRGRSRAKNQERSESGAKFKASKRSKGHSSLQVRKPRINYAAVGCRTKHKSPY